MNVTITIVIWSVSFHHVWEVAELRPLRPDAIHHILSSFTPTKLLLINRTGGRKTHVTWTSGIVLKGIKMVFISLSSLYADQ